MNKFEDLKVTTITMVIKLSHEVNTELIMHFFPIKVIKAVVPIRKKKKCKLPHCEIPGSILSMRYRGHCRGIVKSASKVFKNSVSIDISTKVKNISLKVSKNTIQMCGASSEEDGIEAGNHILKKLVDVQNILNFIRENKTKAKECYEWVVEKTKGEEFIYYKQINVVKKNNIIMNVRAQETDNKLILDDFEIPENLNREFVEYMLQFRKEFEHVHHKKYISKLKMMFRVTSEIVDDINIHMSSWETVMVNYNYSLGRAIDREYLNYQINGNNGFISRYFNALSPSVTIDLPYELPPDSAKRKKGKIPHHTFLVYKSGAVTQSGPGGVLAKDAYYSFINTVNSLENIDYDENDPNESPDYSKFDPEEFKQKYLDLKSTFDPQNLSVYSDKNDDFDDFDDFDDDLYSDDDYDEDEENENDFFDDDDYSKYSQIKTMDNYAYQSDDMLIY